MESLKVIIKKTVAILTAFIIIISQYMIAGLIETTYAIDLLATQSDNVQFRAYFLNGEEELTEIESSIDTKNLKLKIDVAVKNEGYFNGQIALENAGFRFTQPTANSYINKIENNTIYLKQLNAEETASIEIGIEYLDEELIAISTLNGVSTVKLIGTYTSSAGNVEINSGSQVKITWKVPENTKAEITAEIQANSIYKVEEENKKIVQYLISSKLTNNAYPIKTTEITATIPEGATKKEVHKRTTKSTNGEKEFTEANNVKIEGNNLIITVNNSEVDGKISWAKKAEDVYVVTYEYPENIDLSTQSILINGKITTQNDIKLIADPVQLSLDNEKDRIATISKQEEEKIIYKGRIYSGDTREFTSYTPVYVDYAEGISELELVENESKYAKEIETNGEKIIVDSNANVEIKTVKLNKVEIECVFGNTWSISIGENTITNESEADENGIIIVSLPDGTKTITLKTSKPINNGTFVVETVKAIKNTDNSREEKKEFSMLKDSSTIKYIVNNNKECSFTSMYKIGLKDTESKANIQCNQKSLTESNESQELDLTVVLETNEKFDLYKNPTIRIKLPSEIKTAEIVDDNINILYGNNLNKKSAEVIKENNQNVVVIELEGEQTSYLGDALQGTQISIKLINIVLNDITEDVTKYIVMNYTNENATKYVNDGEEKIQIAFIAGEDERQQTIDNNLNMSLKATIGGEEINEGGSVKAGEVITYTVKLSNQGEKDINNLNIDAIIPDNTTLVEINPKYPGLDEESDVYTYEEEYFIEKTEKTILKNNINITSNGEYTFNYMVRVNKYLDETKTGTTKVICNNKSIQFSNTLIPAKLALTLKPIKREANSELEYNVGANYILEIENLTNADIDNTKLIINQNSLLKIYRVEYNSGDNIVEIKNANKEFIIDKILANDKAYVSIESTVQKYTDLLRNAELSCEAIANNVNYRSNIVSEKVVGNKIDITLNATSSSKKTNNYVEKGDIITYNATIKNTGISKAEDIYLNIELSKYLELESITLNNIEVDYKVESIINNVTKYNLLKVEDLDFNIGEGKKLQIIGRVSSNLPASNEILKITNSMSAFGSNGILSKTDNNEFYVQLEKKADEDTNGENRPIDDNGKTDDNTNKDDDNTKKDDDDTKNDDNNESGNSHKDDDIQKYSISGKIWIDANENGARDLGEEILENVKVSAINIETNKIGSNTTSNKDGIYRIENLAKGDYIIAFEYDLKEYYVTKYHASGVEQSANSDGVLDTKNIGGEELKAAYTDIIKLTQNQENIDLGLIKNQEVEIEIEKGISKIVVNNKEGLKTYEFNGSRLAKVEIPSKYLNGSNVIIEYKFYIKNIGKVSGYISDIKDDLPSSLSFNSSLNSDWYEKDNELYNNSLSKKIIKPGEVKEVSLKLTKKMTNSNTGLINNNAEIVKIYNSQGTQYSSNKTYADVIISVKTGIVVSYVISIIFTTLIICGIAIIINLYSKRNKK